MLARRLLLPSLLLALTAAPARAQFFPYYGKNKVGYDNFSWRVYKSPHFEVYYYPEFEQHLARVTSYLESAYQTCSSTLKHELSSPVPVILYKTHSEFEQTNLSPGFVPEAVLAFAEPVRGRMVLPIDEAPDKLQGLVTHELTHVFEFDIIPRNLVQRSVPLWLDEGLADYMRGTWDPLDLMTIRDAAVTEQIPKISRFNVDYDGVSNPRLIYNLGHAVFEFIEGRYGKEGIRQFLYTFRKNIVGGGIEDIYQQAFRVRPQEFDDAFDKWLKERFKPFRDKERPSDYGQDLAPDSEKTPYTQVFAFSPSPSGEMVVAITGNRSEGEADLILLSTKDGTVIRNLTSGFSNDYESIAFSDDFVAGRSVAFDPKGDSVAFLARRGKRRSLYLLSPISGKTLKRVPIRLDQAQSPCLLPGGQSVLISALSDGVSDIYLVDLDSGVVRNLTQDPFYDSNPQISPDGKLVTYTRRISGHDKVYVFPLDDPAHKTQLTFGTHDDDAPTFSSDGNLIYYASNEDDEIFNLRSLDLRTGVIRQYTDALGGNMTPAALPGKDRDRLAFISYFKGEYRLQTLNTAEPVKEVEQEVEATGTEMVDFQPDVVHQVVAENKRKKHTFEKLILEGRPPLNVGVTSAGDFFGGTQVALSDVLGDQNFVFTAYSIREFRSYDTTYLNLSHRMRWGVNAFDYTQFFYPTYYVPQTFYSRQGAIATQRVTGGVLLAQYPFDKFRRLELQAGAFRLQERYDDPEVEAFIREQAAATGTPFFLNNGTIVPISLSLVGETTRFREFGPLTGHTFSLGVSYAPRLGGALSRTSLEGDLRHYLRLGSSSALLATRVRGFKSFGDSPEIFYFGGNMELRGYPYLGFVGNEGFFANAEFRFPLINLMATPIGILGPVRGTLFAGVGAAHFRNEPFRFSTTDAGVSYVRDPVFGEPVSGFRLVDGRASWGFGVQLFFLGYPMHFDWTKLTDLKVSSEGFRFDFWIGFDF